MKRTYIILVLFLITIATVFLLRNNLLNKNIQKTNSSTTSTITTTTNQVAISDTSTKNNSNVQSTNGFVAPLDRASERVTKKPFEIFITPQNSPVQPEKFRGYHTGTDFEIFPEELNADVSVHAVCSGKVEMKKYATGYGGVAVESCTLDNASITVVYGHLKLSSIAKNAGDDLKAGDTLGILGAAYSAEINGERKHLHLGFHKCTEINPALSSKSASSDSSTAAFGKCGINILGYVQNQSELSGWIDPCLYVCQK